MKEIKKLVTEISGRRGKECYFILCCAVEAALLNQPNEPPMKYICAAVRERTEKKSDRAVSKALSRAVDDIWENGDRKRLEQIYARPILEKPAPRDMVLVLAQYLWKSPVEV